MSSLGHIFDKALAAVLICIFLNSRIVTPCPAAEDARANSCRLTYKSLADGNITRSLDIFAGRLKPAFCIAHCGCLGKPYAGVDSHGHCFCGAEQGAPCNSSIDCFRVYSTTGIPASPSATFPSKLELFSSSAATISGLTNVVEFAIASEGKLSFFTPSAGSVAFAETGERKVSMEVESYWGCRTPDYTVNVYSPLNISLICPLAVRPSEEFFCWVRFTEGSGIQSIQWKLDGAPNGAAITSVGEPLVYATGGNLTVDRFESFNTSFDYLQKETVTFINLNYEFTAVGRVKAFEAHFTRPGSIRFQIFRPMCDGTQTEKTYCHSLKKCVSSGCGTPSNRLGDLEFYPPASKPVFCPDVERFKPDDNNTCPQPPVISAPEADYQLMYEFETNVTQRGNTIIKVPNEKNFTVYPGFVLGWTTGRNDSADIGFYSYDSAYEKMYPEYRYKEAYEIFPGSVFSRKLPTATIFASYHLLRSHTISWTNYLQKMSFSNLGQPYTVGVTVTAAESSVSKTLEVAVETDVTGFTLSASNYDVMINVDDTFTISSINTEVGVSYSFHFGETTFNGTFDATVSKKTIVKRFATPGIYTVICRAANKLNYLDQNVTVNVFASISDIKFTKDVDPEPTGDVSTSLFKLSGGGNVTVTYDLGDNTSKRILNVTLTPYFFAELNYKYAKEGDYFIHVMAKHPLQTEYIGQYASVEDTIANVVIDPPGVAATNVSHLFTIASHIGTNVTYTWDWADGTPKSNSSVNNREMSHTYTTYGNRTIELYCYNKISNFTTTKFIEVQDIILGLNFSQQADSLFPIAPTNASAKTTAWFTIEQGTGMDIYVDWDANNPKTRVSLTAYDRDRDNKGARFIGRAIHQYVTIKTYNVTVSAKNAVSNMSITSIAIYETPVQEGVHKMEQLDDQASYIEVNETVCFTMKPAAGTNYLVRYDFNDTTSNPVVTPNTTLCKSWPYWKLPMYTKFDMYNNVSSLKKQIEVFVQMPVHNFTNLAITGGPENTTEPMELVLTESTGDFFNCTWTIFDVTTVTKNLLYDDFLKKLNIKHQFTKPGTYDVSVECINRLYKASASTNVTSYKPTSSFEVAVVYGGACGAKKAAGDKGDGPDKDMYAFGCPLRFVVSEQQGSNITYHFDFGEEGSKGTTTVLLEASHTFEPTLKSSKTIKVTASNPTSTVVVEKELKFLPRITGLKIGNSGPVRMGKEMSYNVTVQQKGFESCFLVDCESGKDLETKEKLHSKFWMGEDLCRYQTKYKPILSKPDLDPAKVAIWKHTFQQTGKFKCTVTGENSVSFEEASTDVIVLDKPCNKPTVIWSDISDNMNNPANATKSKAKTVAVKLTKDCEKTDKVEYLWNISTVNEIDEKRQLLKHLNFTKEDTAMKLPARSLDYGLHEIGLTLCMKDVDPPVCSSIAGFIYIRPSNLIAGFEGGSGRAGGQNKMLEIKATPSHDPDVGETFGSGLKLRWFCKLRTESFPSDYDSLPTIEYPAEGPAPQALNSSIPMTNNFTGCFGNGIGRLKEFDDKTTLIVNSSFMPLKNYYTIRILLWKPNSEVPRDNVTSDYSLYVVPGDPPEIKIKCIVNCDYKKNPDQAFKLQALCSKHCDAAIEYKWSMKKKKVGESDEKLVDIDTEDFKKNWLKTDINNKNLAMKENMMTADYEYVVRLTGSLVGYEDTYGFSLYSITVNVPPTAPESDRACRVDPARGKPLAKIFKAVLTGFKDEDTPLTYLADYRATGTDKEEDWVKFHNSLSQITDLLMLPEGPASKNHEVEFRFSVEDVYRAKSKYKYAKVIVKGEKSEDLSSVLAASKGSTDPAAAGMVANAVLGSLDSSGSGDDSGGGGSVVSSVVDMMDNVDVNSDAGALALASTMGKCMDTGALSSEAQAKAMKAMAKCANQMGPDTPAEIVSSVADSAFGVLLKGSENGGGDAESSDDIVRNLGVTMAGNMVAGEAPFTKTTGQSLVACQAMEAGGAGAVNLGSGGGFDMDSSQIGESGAALQAVGGNGPDKYSNKSSSVKDITSAVVSLEMASGGKPMVVKNLNKSMTVKIKQPVNPYPPTEHTSYTHLLKAVNIVHNPSDNKSSIFIEIKNITATNDSCFFVIIKKGLKPKLYGNDFNFTLPHIVDRIKPDGQNKTAKELELEYRNRFRIFLHGKNDLKEASIGKYYVAVLNSPCNTTNISLPVMTTQYDTGPTNITIPPVNYTFASYTGVCKFFDKTTGKWSTEGLEISQETTQNYTVCLTSHLSSFGGGSVFAKPNTIDFSKAFAGFSNIGENPTVFATTLSIIGIYFLLLAYCRYRDKKDIEKIGVFPLEDNHPSDNYLYEVSVQTGFVKGAGTTADVFIILNGSLGETSPRKLMNPNRNCFNKGDTDAFLISTPFSLGLIKSVDVWHNNAGNSPGWYCMQVQIKDVQNDKKFIFVCNRWLAVEEDDGLIKRNIEIATKNDLVQFDFLFAQTARKNLYDGHIWFSIFTRPPRSHFTRCQRLGCCLTLLLTSMLANAMFYKDPAPASNDPDAPQPVPSDSIHLGPITISVEQIKIGFTSSLVVIPVNLIIATLFQKAKPREEKKKKEKGDKYATDGDEDVESHNGSNRNLVSTSKIDLIEDGKRPSVDIIEDDNDPEMTQEQIDIEKSKKRANFLKMICMPGNEDEEDSGDGEGKAKKKPKPKAMLPHWVIYIAYVLIFLASATAAFFVILYGFQFGKEKSDNWMKSMMLSFWQSVLVIQPVKVLALSVVFAMIIKDPKAASGEDEGGSKSAGKSESEEKKKKKKKKIGEDGEEIEVDESEEEDEDDENSAQADREKNLQFKLPDEKKLEEARQLRLKEKKMKAIIREIVIHLLFVMLCLFIGYSNMDPFAQGYGKGVKSFLKSDLEGVTRVEQYWKWIEDTFIPYLYPGKWYNGHPYELQMVADTEPSKIISMARMRQLRVKKDSCTMHPVFKSLISECNGAYSWSNEVTEQYSAGWKAPLNKTETRQLRHRKRKALWLGLENPWQHQSVLKLKNFPFLGNFGTYSGSSYSVSIGPDERISRLIIKDMKDNFWIDRYTRAVFVEFNIYNANTNLMMIVTLLSEILQTGGWNYFDNVQAIRLYRWQGGIGGLIVLADLVFMIVTLVGLYKLVKKCKKEGVKSYLKSAWNFLHAFVTLFSICTFACVFARVGAVMWAMKQYKNDPEVFVSFAYLGQLDYFVQAFIGFVVMATNLEFLRLLRFNKKIGLLTATIRQSMKPLASFGLIFAFIFMSYVSLAHLLFVDQLQDYKNFGTSVVSLTRMFLGQFDVNALRAAAPYLGPMLFMTYMVAIQMVLINMFIGIICETFEEVRLDIEKQSNDHEIVSFMTHRFKKIAGAAVGPSVDPIYRDWKSDWELTLDSIEEKSDNIVYLLRNVEAEEVRQTQWMDPYKANEKKKNLLKLLIGSDEFTYENEILDSLQLLDKRMKKLSVEKSRKMVYTMAKKKKKDREDEMKSRTEEQSLFSEDDSEEDREEDREENEENSDGNEE